ncbi:MAG: DUF1153 domain-containing protein [Rhodospirillales bacterium]|nr:DUF1153 domain-containing protein [Rhodospirillales bacterium]MDH3914434.1 DUF1153 domain-containing protein [Rhodospirillales bacterium]MDH3916923.1 DUF1153 domain-containing protein [Rhodospirillales bacterium]MDH3967779.1 DUF1153 domain-containing protein [Rhodospirillales bacterium]
MALESPGRPNNVIGPAGKPLSIDDLPPPDTERWVIRRKAEVVAAVRAGLISLEEACERYRLSVEEFLSWQRLIDRHGMRGLRTTRLQQYRRTAPTGDLLMGEPAGSSTS